MRDGKWRGIIGDQKEFIRESATNAEDTWQEAARAALEGLAYRLDSDVEVVAKEIIKYT